MNVLHDSSAFPTTGDVYSFGLTARQYAAIALRVPDSGTDWLDAMIVRSRRQERATAIAAAVAPQAVEKLEGLQPDDVFNLIAIFAEMLTGSLEERDA